jgi:hypothetical protein
MEYLKEQTDELKRYCGKVSALPEGGITFFYLEGLRLPAGCDPAVCDALLCPVARDGYPSRLYFLRQHQILVHPQLERHRRPHLRKELVRFFLAG